jgi:GGDEF domain-containing protein
MAENRQNKKKERRTIMGDFNDRFSITRNDTGEKVRKLPDFPTAPKPAAVATDQVAPAAPASADPPSNTPIKKQMETETAAKAAPLKSVALDPDVAASQERDAAKAANVDRYQVDVPDQYYKVFGDFIANSDDPTATAYRLGTAWRYTQMYDMSFEDAYKNIENLNQALLGDRQYSTAKDNFSAVSDAWKLGLNVVRRGALGTNLAIAEDNGNPYEIDRIRKEVAAVDGENTGLEDRQPRAWYVEALKFGAQSAPFTGAAIGAGLVGGLFGPVAAGASAFAVSMQNAQGSEYLDLRSEGVEPDLARNLSIASGSLQAVVEVALGNTASVVGKAAGVETITSNLFKRLHVTGAWTRAARVIGEYSGEAVEEGVEEALQDLISSGSQALAAELQGHGVEQKTANEVAQSAWENFRGGFLGSLVLGVAGAGINAHTEVRDAIALKDASVSMDSKEAFIKETAASPAFEGLTDADRAEVQSKIWDAAATKRDARINASAADIASGADFAGESETETVSETPAPRGAVQRTSEGKLHLQEGKDVIQNNDGSSTRILKVGNPNEETSYNRYGYIKFREYDDKVVVDDFRMSPGRENIKREFFDEFTSRFSGKNVEWEPRSESGKAFVKQVVAGNPAGSSAGLQYYHDVDAGTVRGRVKLDNQIKQFLPRLDENERAAAVALLETRASVKGQDLETYLGETFHPTVFSDSKTVIPEAAQSAGIDSRGVKGGVAFPKDDISGSAKALVYVTQNSDFSTYTHEIAHVFRREMSGDDLAEAERAFGVTDGSWSRDAEERFAVGFEEYLREGKAPTTALESLFRKMAEFLHRIYNALAARVEVSPDIRHVYDKLIAGAGPLAEIETSARSGKSVGREETGDTAGRMTGQKKTENLTQTVETAQEGPTAQGDIDADQSLADASKSILDEAGSIYSTIPDDMFFQAAAVKKLLEHMSREELIEILHTSDSAGGVPNYRAYRRDIEQDGAWPVQVSLDADSLKWVNDNMGHASGDLMLKEIGETMRDYADGSGVRIYHKSGDEFLAQAKTVNEYMKFKVALDNRLKGVIITVRDAQVGATIEKPGIFLSDGIDNKGDMNAADKNLEPEKSYREDHGERAGRGKIPPGVRIVYDDGRISDDNSVQEYFDSRAEEIKKRTAENNAPTNQFTPSRTRELRKIIEDGGEILFQYIGNTADLSNQETKNLSIAKRMLEDSKDMETIRLATGWFQGLKDKKWRYEISDKNSTFLQKDISEKSVDLSSVLIFPELYKKYPEAKQIKVTYLPKQIDEGRISAAYGRGDDGKKYILVSRHQPNQWELQKAITHELQHWIQEKEGFADGANLDELEGEKIDFKDLEKQWNIVSTAWNIKRDLSRPDNTANLDEIIGMYEDLQGHQIDYQIPHLINSKTVEELGKEAKSLREQVETSKFYKYTPYQMYMNSAGEIEARDIESRYGLSDEQRKYIKPVHTTEKYQADMLFQTDEELIKDASTFESWQNFMEYYEDSPFRPDDAAVPENVDAQWYQTVWEKAHGIIPEESLNAEEMASRAAADSVAPGSPDTQDALWLAEMQHKPAELDSFLRRINDILTTKNDFAPADATEQQDMENTERLKRRITTELRHGSWISNATRVAAGRELTEKARRTLISLMRGAARDYRALYADLMEDPTWSVALADTDAGKLASIADPKLDYSEMSPEQRRKIADRIENAEIARKLKSGELTFDEAQRHIAYLNKELKASETREREVLKQLADEKNETSEDYRRISDWETRQLLKANEEFLMAKARYTARNDKTARMIERGQAITKKYELESQQIKATYDTVFRKFSDLMKAKEISGAVGTALARRESLFEARAENARLREQISAAREARKIRLGLAKRTMRRISFDRIDYESARKIIAIQRAFFPAMQKGLNKWIGTEGPYLREVYSKWKTSDEYRIELEKDLSHRKGGRKLLALLDKDFDTWTRSEREDALAVLPKEDWVAELNLDKLAEEREQALQMDESTDEYKKLLSEALPSRIASRIEKRPFAEWTIEEMEELAGVVDKLYSDGRRMLEAKKLARRNDSADIRDRIKKVIKDAGINEDDSPEEKERKRAAFEKELGMNRQVKGTLADSVQRQSFQNRVLRNGYADANVRRVARILDNGKDGINTDLLYNQEDSCFNEKHRRIRERTRKINAAMTAAGVTIDELYQPIEIKDFYGPGESRSFTVDELIFALKADEDDQSRAAVKYGNMIDDSEKDSFRGEVDGGIIENIAAPRYNAVLAAARALDPKFLTFAESISADYADQYERLNQASIEEFNQPVWRVQKYVPLMRLESSGDTNENRVRDDLLNLSGGRNQSGADKGMTQKRIEIDPLYQRPVQMGLYSTWNDSVTRTEHFVAYAPYVRELNRVYKSVDASNMRGWIRARYGDKMISYLDDYINECANPEAISKQSQLDRIVRTLRGRTAPAYLAWKLSGVLKQFVTSPAPYLTFVSPAEYAAAAFDVARNFSTLSDTIREKSVFMDSRVMDPIIDLIKEQQAKASSPLAAKWMQISDMGMKGLEFADWSCVAPGWLAVYRKTLAQAQRENETIVQTETTRLEKENETRSVETMRTADEIKAIAEGKVRSLDELEASAVKAADDATRMCQPSSRLADLAPMFKAKGENTEALKIITQFQTSLNVIWQNIRYDLPAAVREKQYRQAVGIVGGYIAAGVAVNLMTQGLAGGGGDDDDSLSRARSLLYYSTTQFTDSVPLVGDMVTNLAQKAITGKKEQLFGDDMFPAVSKVLQAGQAATSGDWDRTLQRFGEGIGYGIGAPVSGIKEAGRVIGFNGEDGSFDMSPDALIGRR